MDPSHSDKTLPQDCIGAASVEAVGPSVAKTSQQEKPCRSLTFLQGDHLLQQNQSLFFSKIPVEIRMMIYKMILRKNCDRVCTYPGHPWKIEGDIHQFIIKPLRFRPQPLPRQYLNGRKFQSESRVGLLRICRRV